VSCVFAAAARLLRGLLALAVLLGLLGGVPWLLVRFTGWPLPHHLPSLDQLGTALATPLDDRKILNLLALLAWALWLLFLRDVLVEAITGAAQVAGTGRGRPRPPRQRPVGPVRLVAAVLVGTIAAAVLADSLRPVTTGPSRAAPAANIAAHTPAVAVAPAHPQPVEALDPAGPRPAVAAPGRPSIVATLTAHDLTTQSLTTQGLTDGNAHANAAHGEPGVPGWAQDAPGGIHRVVKGDNLWDIAHHQLGDPFRWRDIYVLNRGKPQVNGYALTDPDEIHIGWVLMLPAATPAGPPAAIAGGTPVPADPPPQTAPPANAAPTTSAAAPATPASPPPATSLPAHRAPANPAPQRTAVDPPTPSRLAHSSAPAPSPHPAGRQPAPQHNEHNGHNTDGGQDNDGYGVNLPSHGWVSLGLAAAIAAVAALLRLHHRRRARLHFPIPVRTAAAPSPVPATVRVVDAAGRSRLTARDGGFLPGLAPAPPAVAAPIGVAVGGDEISLFDLPGPAVALDGPGAPAATRAVLAAVLSTGVADELPTRPTVVTSADLLATLLPPGADPVGLDPAHVTFDGERLLVVADTAAAITHLEQEMIHRRRLLDEMGVDTVAELNTGTRHLEFLPPYVLFTPADPRYTARLLAVAAHRTALHLHPVLLGAADGLPVYHAATDGTLTAAPQDTALDGGRLATLAAPDLADVLAMVARVAPRPETGDEPADAEAEPAAPDGEPAAAAATVALPQVPQPQPDHAGAAPVQLGVLGTVTLATPAGPISIGRSGSRAVLAILAAHPRGRSFEEMAAAIHPNADPDSGINRVRTDLNAVRSLLREATGIDGRGKFIVYDSASSRYRIDPHLITVDLWRMLTAIDRANKATDDNTCLAALRAATDCYRGDFGDGQDWPWAIDYATTYRHQLLSAYARIAEILEADHPDQAVAALEAAIDHDPVNEELYQRVIRIHGRLARPDAVRRTLGLLANRLADLGHAEPSEATRRIADRQLKPTLTTRTPR
jgi:DNA-binding SARP family transcriptional activator/nucleoid-associated protein YgaU